MIAQIDGDIICYKCGFSAQKTRYRFLYNDGSIIDYQDMLLYAIKRDLIDKGLKPTQGSLQKLILPEPVEFAFQRVRVLIDSILDRTGSDSYKMYLTSNDKSNFRYKIATIK